MSKALVTGGGSGLGRAIAEELAKRKYDLILVSRNAETLKAAKTELAQTYGVRVRYIAIDLGREGAPEKLYSLTRGENIDILVNNAGFGIAGMTTQTDLKKENELIRLNVTALHTLTKLFCADFERRDGGTVLNVSSIAGFAPGPLMSGYYASKAYVNSFSLALGQELVRSGSRVRVCTLCPGPVNTGFNKRAGVSFSVKAMSPEEVAKCAVEGMLDGKALIIPGLLNKLCAFAERHLPPIWAANACYLMQRSKGAENIAQKEPLPVSLEEKVMKLLLDKGLTVATAESCTGGLLAGRLINYPGASGAYLSGYVTYSNESKEKLLGVKSETLEKYGAVSAETAKEMCEGAAKRSGTDVGLSTTGVAGPGGGTPEKPVGLVYIGASVKGKTEVKKLNLSGSRAKVRRQAVEESLKLLIKMLTEE